MIDNLPLLYQFIRHRQKNPPPGTGTGGSGKVQPNLMALFMAAGGHVLISGNHPVSNVISRSLASGLKFPLIFIHELEGEQEGSPDLDALIGDESFGYHDLCVDVLDFSVLPERERRGADLRCPMITERGTSENFERDHAMREAHPLDDDFPRLEIRDEAAADGRAYAPDSKGIDAEIYNPSYFFELCDHTPSASRDCIQPIYGLECFDQEEPIYHQPIAFWTSQFADRKPDGVPDAVEARSVVFGFPLVYFKPDQVREALEPILFDEWQLPRSVGQ